MTWPFGETVTVRRVTGKTQDGDGNDVPVYTPQTYHGVSISPGPTEELSQGQTLVTDEIHAIFKPAIPLRAVDLIDISTGMYADTFKVDGEPKHYHSPLTGTSVTDARIRREKG